MNNPASDNDIVTLLIGVNDEYQTHDTSGYRDHFTTCLNKAIQLANGRARHVFVVSIPDYSVTPFGGNSAQVAKEIDFFNAINLSVTNSYGISYTDVTVISRNVKNDREMICSDGLHPSGKQYQLWATKIAANIIKQLK
jgi:lysophospholipase L1-like esterase